MGNPFVCYSCGDPLDGYVVYKHDLEICKTRDTVKVEKSVPIVETTEFELPLVPVLVFVLIVGMLVIAPIAILRGC